MDHFLDVICQKAPREIGHLNRSISMREIESIIIITFQSRKHQVQMGSWWILPKPEGRNDTSSLQCLPEDWSRKAITEYPSHTRCQFEFAENGTRAGGWRWGTHSSSCHRKSVSGLSHLFHLMGDKWRLTEVSSHTFITATEVECLSHALTLAFPLRKPRLTRHWATQNSVLLAWW